MTKTPENIIKIDDTVLLISRMYDYTEHKLAKYIDGDTFINTPSHMIYHQPLKQIFTKTIVYDSISKLTETNVKGVNKEIIDLVKKEKPGYVLWMPAMYEVTESTFDAIRQEGSRVIAWFGDDEYRFGHYCKWWLPHVDYCITHDPESVPRYEALGARVIFAFPCEGIPQDIDWSNPEEKYEISFIGRKMKPKRAQYIDELLKRNMPISLFGRGWPNGFVSDEEMINIFTTSKINLNFTRTADRKGLKGRMTLICLSGGFLLTEYISGLEDFFELDKEVVCFNDTDEMLEKINYYISHDDERRAIARAGWERAVNEYTPTHMISRVFEEIRKYEVSGEVFSPPAGMKMPIWVRNSPSQFYFMWGRAYMEGGRNDLWKNTLALALSSNPFNISARYYSVIGTLPQFIRPFFFKLYLPFRAMRKLGSKLIVKMLVLANSIPGLKTLKRMVSRNLHYS